jgi:adsorption protein B
MGADILALVTHALAVPVSAGILVNGLDELHMDLQYFTRGLHRRERRAITPDELAAAPRQRIAIMVAAWQEADVIESMLEHNRRTLDYPHELYDIFCGTYQNDPATQLKVEAVERRYSNIHKVVVPHDGPTSKADCLNWIYQGIVLEEKKRGHRFDIILMHDAEDIIHPLSLRLYSLLMPQHEFVQTPVFSLPLKYRNAVASTYIDEFAEHHTKDMLVREAIGGLVPSAGVGSAFARDAFEEIALANNQHPFNVDSLTEDYEVGLKFRLANKRVHFACRSLQRERTVKGWFGREKKVVEEEFIATREYFPSKLRFSIRQRARWITGIALQTWRQIGWQGPLPVRYCLWRDRKVIATNSLLLGAYLLIAVMGLVRAMAPSHFSELVPAGSSLWWLMTVNLVLLAWRSMMKMGLVRRLYGLGHGLLAIPRLIVTNVIGLSATTKAIKQYSMHLWTGKPLRWAKTAHEFPSFELLAATQRRLGEFLVEKGKLKHFDIEEALRLQSGTDLPLGEIISGSGMMSSRAITEALSENLSLNYAEPSPEDVPLPLLRDLPERIAARVEAMPVSIANDGAAVIAMARQATAEESAELAQALNRPTTFVLAEREMVRRGRWRAYRRLIEPTAPARPRLGEALLESGALDLAALDAALEEQYDTGERLGEVLLRSGRVGADQLAHALGMDDAYRSVTAEEVDIAVLQRIGYGFAAFYQLLPIRSARRLVVASPFPIHSIVRDELARRAGCEVTATVMASRLETQIALAVAARKAWPNGVALREHGCDGAELAALATEPSLAGETRTIMCASREAGTSPIDFLTSRWRIDSRRLAMLRARAYGLAIADSDVAPADGVLPPELVAQHNIRICLGPAPGVLLAAPAPTPALAQRVASLFVTSAVAWRVLVAQEPAAAANSNRYGVEEAV